MKIDIGDHITPAGNIQVDDDQKRSCCAAGSGICSRTRFGIESKATFPGGLYVTNAFIDDRLLYRRIWPDHKIEDLGTNFAIGIAKGVERPAGLGRIQRKVTTCGEFDAILVPPAPEICAICFGFGFGELEILGQHHFPHVGGVNRHPVVTRQIKFCPAMLPIGNIDHRLFPQADTEYLAGRYACSPA